MNIVLGFCSSTAQWGKEGSLFFELSWSEPVESQKWIYSLHCILALVHFPVTLHYLFRFSFLKWTRSKTLHWIPALHPFSIPVQVQQLPLNPLLVALRILNHCADCWCCAIWTCLEVAKCLALLGKGAGSGEVSWSSTKDGEDGSFNSWAISG